MNRLKELRLHAGLSQIELAKLTEISQRNISYWESGRVELNLNAAIKLSQFFQVDVEYLAGSQSEFEKISDLKHSINYTFEEKELIKKYRQLNEAGKKLIKTVIDAQLDTITESKRK